MSFISDFAIIMSAIHISSQNEITHALHAFSFRLSSNFFKENQLPNTCLRDEIERDKRITMCSQSRAIQDYPYLKAIDWKEIIIAR